LSGSNTTFNVNGWSGHATLTGGGTSNSLNVDYSSSTLPLNITLTNNSLTGPGSLSLNGIQNVTVHGGSGADRVDASGFSGNLDLVGGGGNDTLIGGSGVNLFTDGAGNATMTGGTGVNRLVESGLG